MYFFNFYKHMQSSSPMIVIQNLVPSELYLSQYDLPNWSTLNHETSVLLGLRFLGLGHLRSGCLMSGKWSDWYVIVLYVTLNMNERTSWLECPLGGTQCMFCGESVLEVFISGVCSLGSKIHCA